MNNKRIQWIHRVYFKYPIFLLVWCGLLVIKKKNYRKTEKKKKIYKSKNKNKKREIKSLKVTVKANSK